MGQAQGTATFNTFVKGLVTDTSDINGDPNSIKDGKNFVINSDGSLSKRLGLKIDEDLALVDANENEIYTKTMTTTDGKRWLIVVDDWIRVFPEDGSGFPVYSGSIGSSGNVSVATNDKYIIVAKRLDDIMLIEYNGRDDFYLKTFIQPKVRDFDLIDTGYDIDYRPTVLTNKHKYNLENQGWGNKVYPIQVDSDLYATSSSVRYYDYEVFQNRYAEATGLVADPVINWDTHTGEGDKYPSYSDLVSLGGDTVISKDGTKTKNVFRVENILNTFDGVGQALAPLGRKILNITKPYPRPGLSTGDQPKFPFGDVKQKAAVTFFAGRAFYAAGNNVFFSQVLRNGYEKIDKCYQDADPTSKDISDIIDTDGGQIKIAGASGIFHMEEMGNQLLVFSNNGIWAISGGEAVFGATEYVVRKVTSDTAVSTKSVMPIADGVTFISESGIMVLTADSVSLNAQAENITRPVISKLYSLYSSVDLRRARSTYSPKDNKAYFLIGTDLLVLNLNLKCWYLLEVPDGTSGLYYLDSDQVIIQNTDIQHLGEDVTYNTEQVVIGTDQTVSIVPEVKLIISKESAASGLFNTHICSFSDNSFIDFKDEPNGDLEYDSYFVTQPMAMDNLNTKKRLRQLSCFFTKTETGYIENTEGGLEYDNPSKCYMQVGWNMPTNGSFNNDPRNAWSRQYQVYRFNRYEAASIGEIPGEALETLSTRTSVRGRGRALSLRFSSPTGYDCRLLGWTMDITANTRGK